MEKTWFITGSSSGFGMEIANAALERGDRVAATARTPARLDDLVKRHGERVLPLRLDVTRREEVFQAVNAARDHFGRIDVLVNNAGYGLFGAVEELSEAERRAQLEVNLLGSFHVLQAALPVLRAQRAGHVIQISSVGGVVTFPLNGAYHASKWGVEGLCATLAMEVEPLGIQVTLLEPGSFATNFVRAGQWAEKAVDDYSDLRAALRNMGTSVQFEDPSRVARVALRIADTERPPRHVLVGAGTVEMVKRAYAEKLSAWGAWEADH